MQKLQQPNKTLKSAKKMFINILLLASITLVANWQAEGATAVGLYGPDRYDGKLALLLLLNLLSIIILIKFIYKQDYLKSACYLWILVIVVPR